MSNLLQFSFFKMKRLMSFFSSEQDEFAKDHADCTDFVYFKL